MEKTEICVQNAAGLILAAGQNRIWYDGVYEPGDVVSITVAQTGFYVICLEDTMGEQLVYMKERTFRFEIPFAEARLCYNPRAFVGAAHYFSARPAMDEMKEIRVYESAKGSSRYTTYTLEIEPYSPYSPSQYSRYEVVGVQASSYQTDIGNIPEYSYDGDMSTRWSAEGVGEWLVHDLGEVKEIDAFGVAEWMGSQRKFYFDLQISDDGVNWTTVVADYATSGTSEGIEIIPLDTSVKARYVRYWGKGNSRNGWNNVIELATYARRKHAATQPSPEPNPEPNPNPNPSPGTTTPNETPKPAEGITTPAPNEAPAASGSSSTLGTSQGGSSANTGKNTKPDTVTIPRTADDGISPSALLVVMLVSFAAMACVVYARRKNHK